MFSVIVEPEPSLFVFQPLKILLPLVGVHNVPHAWLYDFVTFVGLHVEPPFELYVNVYF